MSEPTPPGSRTSPQQPAGQPAPDSRGEKTGFQRFMSGSVGRNLGLVVALLLLVIVGAITAPDTFTSLSNVLTILRQASIIGVISIGMTLVIIAGGIDLSVGSVMGLASVVATIAAIQNVVDQTHWIVMIVVALAVGLAAGLDQRRRDRLRQRRRVHGHPRHARRRPRPRRDPRRTAHPARSRDRGFIEFMNADIIGVDVLIWIFAIVAALGWVLLNRTTFGRRTVAIGGNREAARLAGINVQAPHDVALRDRRASCAGIAAVMILGRTTAGTSTHGQLYELDAIAAVVVGGTLLVGGRGTITGTVFGVLIFATLSNVFVQNNLSSSVQAVAKGIIIVIAVLLQQRFAKPTGRAT